MTDEAARIIESTVRLMIHPDDLAYLELQAEETGLTPELVVVQMIRKARKAYEKPTFTWPDVPTIPTDFHAEYDVEEFRRKAEERARQEADDRRVRALQEKRAKLEAELAALEDVPADEFDESTLPRDYDLPGQMVSLADWNKAPPPPSGPPGSLTAPAGVSPQLQSGQIMGDAKGNIVRQNFKHFGSR